MIFFCFSNSADDIEQFQSELRQQFKLKKMGLAAECLGMKLKRNALNGEILLNQESYCQKVLEKFGMLNSHPVSTPLEPGIKLVKSDQPCDLPYQSLI